MKFFEQFLKLFGWRPKPKRDFPVWCSAMCFGALNDAKRLIESKGIKLKAHDIRVVVVKNCQRFSGGWGWHESQISHNVGGLTSPDGILIRIAIDPAQYGNPNALHYGSLVHEMGHHWTITNGLGGDHDPRFDDVLPGWREARKSTGR